MTSTYFLQATLVIKHSRGFSVKTSCLLTVAYTR